MVMLVFERVVGDGSHAVTKDCHRNVMFERGLILDSSVHRGTYYMCIVVQCVPVHWLFHGNVTVKTRC
jgi:hypothetical protein